MRVSTKFGYSYWSLTGDVSKSSVPVELDSLCINKVDAYLGKILDYPLPQKYNYKVNDSVLVSFYSSDALEETTVATFAMIEISKDCKLKRVGFSRGCDFSAKNLEECKEKQKLCKEGVVDERLCDFRVLPKSQEILDTFYLEQ
jgi:hypothetical protein